MSALKNVILRGYESSVRPLMEGYDQLKARLELAKQRKPEQAPKLSKVLNLLEQSLDSKNYEVAQGQLKTLNAIVDKVLDVKSAPPGTPQEPTPQAWRSYWKTASS